jgi:hypothetical protein
MKRIRHSQWVPSSATLKACLTALGAGAVASGALAQSVFITPPSPSPRPSEAQSNATEAESGEGGAFPQGTSDQPFRWRQLTFRPHASYRFLYGNGILSQTNREQKTIVQTIAVGMAVDLGKHWVFDYTPSLSLYSDSSFKNAVNHSLSLNGHTSYEDWTYGLSFGMAISSDPQVETGQQTDQQSFTTSGTVTRQLNSGLSAELNAAINYRLANEFNDSRDYSTMGWLNQQFGPSLGAGIGVGGGFEEASEGNDMTYERVLGRIIWHITHKLDLSLNGGPEFRQFLDSDRPTLIAPTYGATLAYQLSEKTSLSVNGSRSVGSSYFANQFTETTRISASLNRSFLQRYFVGVSGGYSLTTYESSLNEDQPREDTTTFASVSVGTSFLKRGSASVFYSISDNSSDEEGFTYTSNQVGISLKYAY